MKIARLATGNGTQYGIPNGDTIQGTLANFISHVITPLPGDVIATDAPRGIRPTQSGDADRNLAEPLSTK